MMKNYIIIILLLTFSLFACKSESKKGNNELEKISFKNYKKYYSKKNIPEPLGFVSDYSMMFTDKEREELETFLDNYEQNTSNEIVVVTFDTIPIKEYDIHRYSTEIANTWGVGKKEKNNGLVIAISSFERKIGITTGYGVEKILTDHICKQTLQNVIVPKFKKEEYYKGVKNGLDTLIVIWDKGIELE